MRTSRRLQHPPGSPRPAASCTPARGSPGDFDVRHPGPGTRWVTAELGFASRPGRLAQSPSWRLPGGRWPSRPADRPLQQRPGRPTSSTTAAWIRLIDYEYAGNNDACFVAAQHLGRVPPAGRRRRPGTAYYGRMLQEIARAMLLGMVGKYGSGCACRERNSENFQ